VGGPDSGSQWGIYRVDSSSGDITLLSGAATSASYTFPNAVSVVPGDIPDSDGDGIIDLFDNCALTENADQSDADGNRVGDACNDHEDLDGDEFADQLDNCPDVANADQRGSDGDPLGDACDPYPNDTHNLESLADLEVANQQIGVLQTDLTVATGELAVCSDILLDTELDLAMTLAALGEAVADTDEDGARDTADSCPGTPGGDEVDLVGCSLDQFCGAIDASTGSGGATCNNSDWRNDEPRANNPEDCKAKQGVCAPR
jgi:hypothetical protein